MIEPPAFAQSESMPRLTKIREWAFDDLKVLAELCRINALLLGAAFERRALVGDQALLLDELGVGQKRLRPHLNKLLNLPVHRGNAILTTPLSLGGLALDRLSAFDNVLAKFLDKSEDNGFARVVTILRGIARRHAALLRWVKPREIKEFFASFNGFNKYQRARILTEWFEELGPAPSAKRKLWQSEFHKAAVFDAAATVMTFLASE